MSGSDGKPVMKTLAPAVSAPPVATPMPQNHPPRSVARSAVSVTWQPHSSSSTTRNSTARLFLASR